MTKVGAMEVELSRLAPREKNRAVGGVDPASVAELAASIRQKGVLEPLLIRPLGTKKGADYEIMAGERRYRASILAGLEKVPCIVNDCDEAEAMEIGAIENLHRADLHPLDEADEIVRLMEHYRRQGAGSGDVTATVAGKLGKTEYYIRQRASLANLCPTGRKLLGRVDKEEDEAWLTLGHALVLARFPKHVQEEVIKHCRGWSVSQMQRRILDDFFMDLKTAPFNKDDAKLYQQAGACSVCPKRTGHEPGLFPEVTKGERCLDRACFNVKLDRNFAVVLKTVRKEEKAGGAKHLLVEETYEHKQIEGETIVPRYSWREAGKDEKGATPALIVDGPRRGRVVLAVKQAQNAYGTPVKAGKLSDAEKKKRIEKQDETKERSALRSVLFEAMTKAAKPGVLSDVEVLRLVVDEAFRRVEWNCSAALGAALGWEPSKLPYGGVDYRGHGERLISKLGRPELVTLLIQTTVSTDLGYAHEKKIAKMAQALGVDVKKLTAESVGASRAEAKERARKRLAREAKKSEGKVAKPRQPAKKKTRKAGTAAKAVAT